MSDSGHLRLFYDYVDPASYLLERRLRPLEESGAFSIILDPFEASPPPSPLLDPLSGEWAGHWEAMIRSGALLGIDLYLPWIVPWSRKAHELALHAKTEGCFREIHDTIYRAYLLEGLDIGRIDVLVDLARRHGLDAMQTKAILDIDSHRDVVAKRREEAADGGVIRPSTLLWQGKKMEGYPDDRTLSEFLALGE